jgi:hypothetical protein
MALKESMTTDLFGPRVLSDSVIRGTKRGDPTPVAGSPPRSSWSRKACPPIFVSREGGLAGLAGAFWETAQLIVDAVKRISPVRRPRWLEDRLLDESSSSCRCRLAHHDVDQVAGEAAPRTSSAWEFPGRVRPHASAGPVETSAGFILTSSQSLIHGAERGVSQSTLIPRRQSLRCVGGFLIKAPASHAASWRPGC